MTRLVTYERGLAPLGPAVAAIGVFDGVHLGHQELVRDAIDIAHERGVLSVVITFDRDPDRVVQPDSAAPQLLELEDKLSFLAALDPDVVLVVPFDASVASMAPEAFVDDIVLAACSPVVVLVGHDFRFGSGARGDVFVLSSIGDSHGFSVLPRTLVEIGGAPVTSTRIRALVTAGDVKSATELLGRPHRVRGRTMIGRGVGTALGIPTANVHPHTYAAVPADGVYAAYATVLGRMYGAGVAVGVPPTFPEATSAVEVHLLDFDDGDLHGEEIAVDFVSRIREQRVFKTELELSSAIRTDIDTAREALRDDHPW
ncbi:MAG: riboflavin biosynthesis protein RibF [Coriobacteriia bacterium]